MFLTLHLTRRYTLRSERSKRGSSPDDPSDGVKISANEAAQDDFVGDYLKNLTGLPTIFSFRILETATGGFSKEIEGKDRWLNGATV